MLIDRVLEARVAAREVPCTIRLAGGKVLDVHNGAAEGELSRSAGSTLAAAGRVVVPAFVDAHVHLDKAFLNGHVAPVAPHLECAIAAVAALRTGVPSARFLANAERAVDLLVRHGVCAARVHVEVDTAVGLELVEMHLALAERVAHRIELQLVAFPQRGLARPGMRELFAAAMARGLGVVGGCPYVDADPRPHLDAVFALAERHGAPIDLHLDFSDDPGQSLLAMLAARVRAHGMAGRVTVGHVTTLAAMAPDEQLRALDAMAASGIDLVILPATDLYLGGHGAPGTRSLAPLERARAAGVRVAIANNNLQNPFAPYGNGNLLQAAWLAGLIGRAAPPLVQRWLLEAITSEPAAILGLAPHGVAADLQAHLVVLDTESPDSIVPLAPAVLGTIRGGHLVYALTGPQLSSSGARGSEG